MKRASLVTLMLAVLVVSTGCPRRMPDLAVTSFVLNGQATLNLDDEVEVPVVVQVENQGNAPADLFLLTASYESNQGTVVVPFTVNGQADPTFPSTSEPLAPGESVVFAGWITVTERNQVLGLYIQADTCTDDHTHPEYCRVNESDEENNIAGPLNVLLP